jgi:hypothetical protein
VAQILGCIHAFALNWVKICDECRLWQRKPPAVPENSAAFWKEEFKNSLFHFSFIKKSSSMDAQRLFKGFLTRTVRVASYNA